MPNEMQRFEPPVSLPMDGYLECTDEVEETHLGVHGHGETGADLGGSREDLR